MSSMPIERLKEVVPDTTPMGMMLDLLPDTSLQAERVPSSPNDGLEQVIDLMPKGRLVTWIFSIPFVRPLAERFYRWFARNRYRLGCGAHCQFRPQDLDFGDDA